MAKKTKPMGIKIAIKPVKVMPSIPKMPKPPVMKKTPTMKKNKLKY